MPEPMPKPDAPPDRRLPILIRHAISLSVAFAIALPLSYFIGLRVYEHRQLDKLQSTDQTTFDEGRAYVYTHAIDCDRVMANALRESESLPTERASQLILTLLTTILESTRQDETPAYGDASPATAQLIERMKPREALGFYLALDANYIALIERSHTQALFATLEQTDNTLFMEMVQRYDAELLWSKQSASRSAWIRWLSLISDSNSEIAQQKAARLLGELPDDLDTQSIPASLLKLSVSPHDAVRAQVLQSAAGYAHIAKDPTDYEQIIFALGNDKNREIARRVWMIVGHLNPLSGYAVNWKEAEPFVAEAMLWAAVKTNPDNPKPAVSALKTPRYEAAGALAINEWQRPAIPVTDADLLFQSLIKADPPSDRVVVWRSILVSKDYMNAEVSVIQPYGYGPVPNEELAAFYLAGSWVRAGFAPERDVDNPFSDYELLAFLEGLLDHGGNTPGVAENQLVIDDQWPVLTRLVAARLKPDTDTGLSPQGLAQADPITRDLFVAGAMNNNTLRREMLKAISSRDESISGRSALLAGITNQKPQLITGVSAEFLRKNPDITSKQLHAMSAQEIATLGLSRVDALPTLLKAAESAPKSADRTVQVKLLNLALWMRGDLGDDFIPMAEAMLFDADLPTSTVLMCLLYMKRPIALDYLFGDLVSPQPDLQELFIQQRWWHVFRRFVETSDLTLWLWGDPAAQQFQIEAMRQWYAVNRWRIDRGWWPDLIDD